MCEKARALATATAAADTFPQSIQAPYSTHPGTTYPVRENLSLRNIYIYIYIYIYIHWEYIRHRALGHQWTVANAVGVCQVTGLENSLRDLQSPVPGLLGIARSPFFLPFFHTCFGTVQKSLFEALGAILTHFLFDLGFFLGAPGPLKNSPKCCKGHHF